MKINRLEWSRGPISDFPVQSHRSIAGLESATPSDRPRDEEERARGYDWKVAPLVRTALPAGSRRALRRRVASSVTRASAGADRERVRVDRAHCESARALRGCARARWGVAEPREPDPRRNVARLEPQASRGGHSHHSYVRPCGKVRARTYSRRQIRPARQIPSVQYTDQALPRRLVQRRFRLPESACQRHSAAT